jgi:hypothetical protein
LTIKTRQQNRTRKKKRQRRGYRMKEKRVMTIRWLPRDLRKWTLWFYRDENYLEIAWGPVVVFWAVPY